MICSAKILFFIFMGNRLHIFLVLILSIMFFPAILQGQDSTHVIRLRDITPRVSLLQKMKGDLSFVPHYSVETGAGVMFSYVTKGSVTLIGDISTQGHALLGIAGSHPVAKGKWRLDYKGYYSYAAMDFWGIGYENASNRLNRTGYDRKKIYLQGEALKYFSPYFYAGPSVSWDWIIWDAIEGSRTNVFGYGAVAVYDTRNNAISPQSGVYVRIRQRNYTGLDTRPFYISMAQFNVYRQIWDGGVLAFDLVGEFSYGSVPWTLLPTIGGTERMRGYYRGRYMDNNAVSSQVELRQHIWGMTSGAAWVGVAHLWGKATSFNLEHALPNAGLGIRFKLADGVILRFDYGFGRDGQNGFVLGLNEAF